MATEKESEIAASWHAKVEGRWFGAPSHYDREGRRIGYSQPRRTILRGSEQDLGVGDPNTPDPERVLIDVPADLHLEGPLKSRIEVDVQSAWVRPTERSRVYEGPDFFGAGYPYGSLTLGWVFFAPWNCDAKVMVQILPDKVTQVYDNLQFVGEGLCSSLNGLYLLAQDHDDNPETQARVAAFLESERSGGHSLFRHSTRKKGQWTGTLEAYDRDQQRIDDVQVCIDYTPVGHHRSELHVQLEGGLNHAWRGTRYRHDSEFFYEGPEIFGNAVAFGRALYLRQQLTGGLRLVGRDFLLDRDYAMAVAWEFKRGHHLEHVLHGKLDWSSDQRGMDNR